MPLVRTLLRLGGRERQLALQAAIVLAGITLALRFFPPLQWWLLRKAGRPVRSHMDRVSPESISWAVTAAGRRIPGATCLAEAIAACWLARRHGHDAMLRIGVAPGCKVKAHAWVECGDKILVGDAGSQYEAMPPLPLQRL
jgi:hypothetical protein